MADELVLHFQGQDRLLGSPARLDRATPIVAAVLVLAIAVRLLIGARAVGDLVVFVAGLSALVLAMLSYARLRFANAGLFLADGRIGVIGALGGRTGVDATQVDHLQLCTLTPAAGRSYGLLLFIDRSDRAILRLSSADLIPAEGLEELSRKAGVRLRGSWQDTYAPADLARRFPGCCRPGDASREQCARTPMADAPDHWRYHRIRVLGVADRFARSVRTVSCRAVTWLKRKQCLLRSGPSVSLRSGGSIGPWRYSWNAPITRMSKIAAAVLRVEAA